jgi:hypothetical protein
LIINHSFPINPGDAFTIIKTVEKKSLVIVGRSDEPYRIDIGEEKPAVII